MSQATRGGVTPSPPSGWEGRIDAINDKLDTLKSSVLRLEGSVITRAEISAEMSKRVSVESYQIAHQALQNEMRDLESDFHEFKVRAQGGWQRAAPWVAIAITIVFGGISTLFVLASLVVSILALVRS